MLRKSLAFAALLAAASCFGAETGPIGSVVAHGELLRIDGYAIKGSGTAFEGTIVETGSDAQSNADLLLSNGTRITLHSNSRGALYHDRLVLDRGEADLVASAPFRVEVDGLVLRTTGTNASDRISIGVDHTVGVLTKVGQLEVSGAGGNALASIGPQNLQTFVRDESGNWIHGPASPNAFSAKDHDHDGDGEGRGHHHHPHPSH